MNDRAHDTGERFFRRLMAAAALLVAAILAFRFSLVESTAVSDLCRHGGPWWCAPRNAMVHVSYWEIPGAIGLAAGLLASVFPSRVAIAVAVLFGGWGMALYSAGIGTVGFLLGLLQALRR
ncbi:MAG: hypothetical protein EXQ87_01235 [Alphaproteobacteria bacterium]|nr:hypothetical protein [Alphaproteobacteria bacterium]